MSPTRRQASQTAQIHIAIEDASHKSRQSRHFSTVARSQSPPATTEGQSRAGVLFREQHGSTADDAPSERASKANARVASLRTHDSWLVRQRPPEQEAPAFHPNPEYPRALVRNLREGPIFLHLGQRKRKACQSVAVRYGETFSTRPSLPTRCWQQRSSSSRVHPEAERAFPTEKHGGRSIVKLGTRARPQQFSPRITIAG